MDRTSLEDSVRLCLGYNNDLTDIMDIWALQLQCRATGDDVETAERCRELTQSMSVNLISAYHEAYNAKKMAHYIADKAIRDAVTRLATQMRSQNPQNPTIAFVLQIFFESPESNDKRKDLEARIKARMGLDVLVRDNEGTEFAEKVQTFEKEAGELALEFAIQDAKKMVDDDLRMLAVN